MGSVMERKEDHLVKWEVVVQVQEKGSLGVGHVARRNGTLLRKWLWCFQQEGEALWYVVIRSKYGWHENGIPTLLQVQAAVLGKIFHQAFTFSLLSAG